jgi:hypothetical protein
VRTCDGEMMQIPAPAIMAAQDSADNASIGCLGDGAESRVSSEKCRDSIQSIGLTETDALALFPQREDLCVIGHTHRSNSALDSRHGDLFDS